VRLRQYTTQAAQDSTVGAGVRLLQHKDSRIVYFSPRDMAGGSTGSTGGTSTSGADSAVKNLIETYIRYWI